MTRPRRSAALSASTTTLLLRTFAAVLVIASFSFASRALALAIPPPPTTWYTDTANLLDASSAAALNDKLRAFEQQSGAQVIIYVFPSLEQESLEDFTIRCAEKWKVGNKKYDNGLILFVFVKERKVRVEVGYGLEGAVTDAFSSQVIREDIAPHFQTGDYAGGLNAAADALMAKIRGEEPAHPEAQPAGRKPSGQSVSISPRVIVFLVILFLFIVPRLFYRRRGYGGGGCSGCIWPLLLSGGRGTTFGGGGWGGGGGGFGGFGGGGGFSGGGGSFGGGGASGGW